MSRCRFASAIFISVYISCVCLFRVTLCLTIQRAEAGPQREIFPGVRRSITGPQILLGPQVLSGAHAGKSFFPMGVDLHLKVRR